MPHKVASSSPHTYSEPADTADRALPAHGARDAHSFIVSAAKLKASSKTAALTEALAPEGELPPDEVIPAAGRGNSEDGKNWVNPSANQLFRALARKDKVMH